MKRKTVEASALIREVRALAREYPKAVYRPSRGSVDCDYMKGVVENGPPTRGCIVGQAMRRAGFRPLPGEYTEIVRDVTGIQGTRQQIDWLSVVQTSQDEGSAWADAVKAANLYLPRTR